MLGTFRTSFKADVDISVAGGGTDVSTAATSTGGAVTSSNGGQPYSASRSGAAEAAPYTPFLH